MLIDCGRTLRISLIDSKYVALMCDEPPLMKCPYPDYETYSDGRIPKK